MFALEVAGAVLPVCCERSRSGRLLRIPDRFIAYSSTTEQIGRIASDFSVSTRKNRRESASTPAAMTPRNLRDLWPGHFFTAPNGRRIWTEVEPSRPSNESPLRAILSTDLFAESCAAAEDRVPSPSMATLPASIEASGVIVNSGSAAAAFCTGQSFCRL